MARDNLATVEVEGTEFNAVGCEFEARHSGETHFSVALQGLGRDTVFSARKWLALMACQKEITKFFIDAGQINGDEKELA